MAILAVLILAGSAQAQRAPSVAPPSMQAVAPGLAAYTDDVLFGEVWKRPGLSSRDRSLVTISALIGSGHVQQLAGHLGRALDNGVKPSEIAGIITQMAFYEGWPVAVSAAAVADEVFKKRGIDEAALTQAALRPPSGADFAPPAAIDGLMRPVAPALAELTKRVVFGDLWHRTDLSPRDRSLATVAGLIAAGDIAQLPAYITRALLEGVTPAQLGEAVTHLAFYVGWARATAVVPLLSAAEQAATAASLVVTRAGSDRTPGPASHFTGQVSVMASFHGTGATRIRGSSVSFAPGARTNWHTHPLGQTLIVTQGHAWVQQEGGPVLVLGPGDTVSIPPGVRHWHGAPPDEAMTHIAVTEAHDSKTVDWLDPVTDAQYRH